MSSNRDENDASSTTINRFAPLVILVPIGLMAIGLLVASRRQGASDVEKAGAARGRAGRRARPRHRVARQRALITLLINALENDMMRRGIIVGLKIARSRM